jgi:thiol:disulfide interchange protein DsbD
VTRAALVVLACLCAAAPAEEANPIHWKAGRAPVQAKAGGLIFVPVVASIDAGWHLYSLKKLDGGPIPTTLAIAPGQPFRLDGKIESPEPILMDDPNFGMTVEFYLETARFVVPIRVAPDTPAGQQTLKLTARYQTCSEKLCLPPKTVTLEVPVAISR